MSTDLDRLLTISALVIDCGDSSCAFARERGGMRTNGGCRCAEDKRMRTPGALAALGEAWRALPALVKRLQAAELALSSPPPCIHSSLCPVDHQRGIKCNCAGAPSAPPPAVTRGEWEALNGRVDALSEAMQLIIDGGTRQQLHDANARARRTR